MPLYNLRSLTPDTYMIAKFSDDFEVESTYTLTKRGFSYLCDCPANSRAVVTKPCRHKLMMPTLLPAVDTDRFYDFDTGKFCTPLGDLLRPTADPEGQDSLPNAGEALRAEGEAPQDMIEVGPLACRSEPVAGEAPGLSIPSPAPTPPTIRRR